MLQGTKREKSGPTGQEARAGNRLVAASWVGSFGPVALRRTLLGGLILWQMAAQALAFQISSPAIATKQLLTGAHQDCLKSCHQLHTRPKSNKEPKPPTMTSICNTCHQGPSAMVSSEQLAAAKLPNLGTVGSRHGGEALKRKVNPFSREVRQGQERILLKDDCTACHDVHGKHQGLRSRHAFDAYGQPMAGNPITWSQVCFGCHADTKAARFLQSTGDLFSQANGNLGLLFAKGARSSHAIGATVQDRPDLPSLRGSAFREKLDCTSCHGNPDPNGPKGPHASTFPHLLKASYGREGELGQVGSQSSALCYLCHAKASIEGNQSFPLHREHLEGFRKGSAPWGKGKAAWPGRQSGPSAGFLTPPITQPGRMAPFISGLGNLATCATCHDPHGSVQDPSLISFDRQAVTPSSVGSIEFRRLGLGSGSCTLSCHGYDHVNTRY